MKFKKLSEVDYVTELTDVLGVDENGEIKKVDKETAFPAAAVDSTNILDYIQSVPATITAGDTEATSGFYTENDSNASTINPPIIHAFGIYNDGTNGHVINVDYDMYLSSSGTFYGSFKIPEALEYDVRCFARSNVPVYGYGM